MDEEKKEKKVPAKKTSTAKADTKATKVAKTTAKKTTSVKDDAKKVPAKKTTTKKATAKATEKKAPAKKVTTKKEAAKKETTKKTATKTTTKKATATKATKVTKTTKTTKATAKKAPAKKSTRAKKVEEVKVSDDDLEVKENVETENANIEVAVNEAPVETVVEEPIEAVTTNSFGTTTVSAEVNKAYNKTEVEEDIQEEKKARKSGRKVITTMIVLIVIAIAIFLGLWYFSKVSAHDKIVDTLEKLKAGDKATEIELIDLGSTLGLNEAKDENDGVSINDLLITNNSTDENKSDDYSLTNEIIENSKKGEDDYIDFFKNMEYEIVEEKADFVDGYVRVKIVNKNIGKIIKKYYIRGFALSIQSAFSTQQSSAVQEKLDAYLKELLTSDEIEKVGTEVTFKLRREGFEWKLDIDKQELCDAILPGLREQLKDFDL